MFHRVKTMPAVESLAKNRLRSCSFCPLRLVVLQVSSSLSYKASSWACISKSVYVTRDSINYYEGDVLIPAALDSLSQSPRPLG